MKLVTFNLRVGFWGTNDKINGYIHRSGMIAYKVNEEKPDIICFQEVTTQTLPHLRMMLPDYDVFHNCREPGLQGEGLAIALRRGKVELVGLDAFWLSETPRVPGSRYECASEYVRICQYAVVKIVESNKLFRLYNNHFDHSCEEARILQIRQVLNFIEKKDKEQKLPFAITGDFNATPQWPSIRQFYDFKNVPLKDVTENLTTSFHAYGQNNNKIDFIFTDAETGKTAGEAYLWDTTRNGIYLSDHYPVAVTLEI